MMRAANQAHFVGIGHVRAGATTLSSAAAPLPPGVQKIRR
jgi:hypothetical protein